LLTSGWSSTQIRAGILFAYRGRVHTGDVDYNGAYLNAPNVPLSGTSTYTGVAGGQLLAR
jgi:hypothetical protein